jgi:hypothetical protein
MTRVRSKERNKAKKISISINNPNTSPSSVNKKGESIALNVTRDGSLKLNVDTFL